MIGFIGGGNMAEALIKGIAAKHGKDIIVSEPLDNRRDYLEKTYRVKTTPDNMEVLKNCAVIILAVKPQNMDEVTAEISDMTNDKLIVSIAAGIPISYLSSRLKTSKIIRVMPNTPALIQEGMSVMSMCECIHDKELGIIKEIFMSVGSLLMLPEKYMNAVTALSGSGPGFFAYFIEALIEGGIKTGLDKADARTLAIQTMLGTARLLDTGMDPAKLREMVTSPGGTTAAGLKVFQERGLTDAVIASLEAATNRARELGGE
jgi:pyrroline-5-carboxylate reductase